MLALATFKSIQLVIASVLLGVLLPWMFILISIILYIYCGFRSLSTFNSSVLRLHTLLNNLCICQILMLVVSIWLVADDGVEVGLLC